MYETPEGTMPTNVLIASFASAPTWLAAAIEPTLLNLVVSVCTSVVLMFLGKLMDLAIQAYKEKRGGNKKIERRDHGD